MTAKQRTLWTFAISSVALFMVTLDNLVVTTALPVIRKDLHASLQGFKGPGISIEAYRTGVAALVRVFAAAASPRADVSTASSRRRRARSRPSYRPRSSGSSSG